MQDRVQGQEEAVQRKGGPSRRAAPLWMMAGLVVVALGMWRLDIPEDPQADPKAALWTTLLLLGAVVVFGAGLWMVPAWGMARAAAKTALAMLCSFGCMVSLVWASLDTLADPNPHGVSWVFGFTAALGVAALVSVWCDE